MEVGRILPEEAAKIIDKSTPYVRIGLQQGRIPIGTAVKMSSVYSYHISPKLLEEYSGKDVKKELEKIRAEKKKR